MAWRPTMLGLLCLAVLFLSPVWLWWSRGESFLSETRRLPAEVLIVEGWIGIEALHAAGAEFREGNYEYLIATGGLTASRWEERHSSYAQMAERELIRAGVPRDRIIVAPAKGAEAQRTFESAAAVWRCIQSMDLHPKAVNILTLGAHARRSRMVFAKVLEPGIQVGVVALTPESYRGVAWWHSTERTKDVITESAGILAELVLNSGRDSNNVQEESRSESNVDSAYFSGAAAKVTAVQQ